MSLSRRVYVDFKSEAFDDICPELFEVVSFEGTEAISQPFRFDLTLVSNEPDIDLSSLIGKKACMQISRDGRTREVHGVISELQQDEETKTHKYCYKATLVPRIWLMSLSRQNQIYQEMTVPEIVSQEILGGDAAGGMVGDELELRLQDNYPIKEYTVQYRETDLNFISRLLEHEGIYYYFDHSQGCERLVLCDNNTKLDPVCEDNTVCYVPPSGLASFDEQAIHRFSHKQKQISQKVILKDYNYRKPHIPLLGEAETFTQEENADHDLGYGEQSLYGDHFKDTTQGENLANIRAQALRCQQQVCFGHSDALLFEAGKLFQMEDHYREDFNQQYLVTTIHHKGGQALPGISGSSASGDGIAYENNFEVIATSVEYRPALNIKKPKLYGFMSAIVDGSIDSDRAQIDENGRYKLIMPFDVSGTGEGKASRWVRKAEAYGGQGTGMAFPLLKGTEVMWSCMDGDLDRPIITGVVPGTGEGLNKSMVTSANSTDNIIKTPSGIVIQMKDGKGTSPQSKEGTEHAETRMASVSNESIIAAAPANTAESINHSATISHGMAYGDKTASLIQQQQHSVEAVFTSIPDTEVKFGDRYSYSPKVSWGNGKTTFKLLDNPDGMRVNDKGRVIWPSADANGRHRVKIQATKIDGSSKPIFQIYWIDVAEIDSSIRFVSTPITSIKSGGTYSYQVQTDDDAVTYSVISDPVGITTIGSTSGLLTWTAGNVGVYTVTVTATSTADSSISAEQKYAINVTEDSLEFVSTPLLQVKTGDAYQYQAEAQGGVGVISYAISSSAGPTTTAIDPTTGLVTWTAGDAEIDHTVTITATSTNPVLTVTQVFTLKVIEDLVTADNDGPEKSYSVFLPEYREGADGSKQFSYMRIGSYTNDEKLAQNDFKKINVYYTNDNLDGDGNPITAPSLASTYTEASDNGHKIMDILNATIDTFKGVEDSDTSSSGLYEGLNPERFGLMEYTDGAKLMVHQNGCFDLAAGTSVTYDSLGTMDSLISIVLGETSEGSDKARMIKSERFHNTDDEWVTETWEKSKTYSFLDGQQECVILGDTFDYTKGINFEANVAAKFECNIAAQTELTLGVSTACKVGVDVSFGAGLGFSCVSSDSLDICGGSNEMKGKTVLLQYEKPGYTKQVVAGVATVAAAALAATTGILAESGMTTSDQPGSVIAGTQQLKDSVATPIMIIGTVAASVGLLAAAANKIKNMRNTPKAQVLSPDTAPFIEVESDKIVLCCGQSSITLSRDGKVRIHGTDVQLSSNETGIFVPADQTVSYLKLKPNAVTLCSKLGTIHTEAKLAASFSGNTKTIIGKGVPNAGISGKTVIKG